jgi:gamma-D-glutamyl-L-lysine dipeptidyl-peptidase
MLKRGMKRLLLGWAAVAMLAAPLWAAPAPATDDVFFTIQTAAFARKEAADKAAERLQQQSLDAFVVVNDTGNFTVRVGQFASRAEARKEAEALKGRRIIPSFLVLRSQVAPIAEAAPAPDVNEASCRQEAVQAGLCTAADAPAKGGSAASELAELASDPLGAEGLGMLAVQTAERYIGVPYKRGGTNPETGMDCSGFVRKVFSLVGIHLPRTSAEQFHRGKKIGRQELVKGDLVFFGRNQRVNHVGIYIGDGKFIHAPRPNQTIRIARLDMPEFVRRFLGARRLF